jgi:hypothetical protein
MSIEKNITRLFEEIESSKNSINEILSGSEELFGGSPVRIPRDGSHAGQSGWASGNAWDIGGTVGTPVYAIADGQAVTFRDYGSNVIVKDGKKLFGQDGTLALEFTKRNELLNIEKALKLAKVDGAEPNNVQSLEDYIKEAVIKLDANKKVSTFMLTAFEYQKINSRIRGLICSSR